MDEIITFKNDIFEDHISKIYPNSLTLNKTNKTNNIYLDLELKINDSKLEYKAYNKDTIFKFSKHKLNHYDNNLPFTILINVIDTKISRFARINKVIEYFKISIFEFIKLIFLKGFNRNYIKKHIIKVLNRHNKIQTKFNVHANKSYLSLYRYYISK